MNIDTARTPWSATCPSGPKAHVPQPPEPDIDPNTPPGIPPGGPDEVDLPEDLPARENPPDIDEPQKPEHKRVLFWPGHLVVFSGHARRS